MIQGLTVKVGVNILNEGSLPEKYLFLHHWLERARLETKFIKVTPAPKLIVQKRLPMNMSVVLEATPKTFCPKTKIHDHFLHSNIIWKSFSY